MKSHSDHLLGLHKSLHSPPHDALCVRMMILSGALAIYIFIEILQHLYRNMAEVHNSHADGLTPLDQTSLRTIATKKQVEREDHFQNPNLAL